MKRYYFTDYEGENVMYDHIGNIRGARSKAQKYANKSRKYVFINDCETDAIVDVVYPD